jgi:DnaJ like chaperone protein
MLQKSQTFSVSSTGRNSAISQVANGFFARIRYLSYRVFAPAAKSPSAELLRKLKGGDREFKDMSFTFAIVAISARIACADGSLTREKYLAFRECFPLKSTICGKIRSLFTLACSDQTPLEHYVKQITYIYPQQRELFTVIISSLFRIATADGVLTREAERLVANISLALDISPATYQQLYKRHTSPFNPQQILGVTSHTKPKLLKKRYHALMRNYHPDRHAGDDLSPELQSLLQLRSSEINFAYKSLTKRAA